MISSPSPNRERTVGRKTVADPESLRKNIGYAKQVTRQTFGERDNFQCKNFREFMKPGVMGKDVDAVARGHITDLGFDEYPHALGHQIGKQAHDGAGLLSPEWERYGNKPYALVEEGQCYTLEPRVNVPGYGVATMEEMVVVTKDGVRYLSEPQTEIMLIAK